VSATRSRAETTNALWATENAGAFARSETAREFFGEDESMMDSNFYSPESTPGGDRATSVEANAALRTVIQLTLRTDLRRVLAGCPIDQSGLRENMRVIGAHARRNRLRAEQLLILIKAACAALPEARRLQSTPAGSDILARVISIAVDEYYGK
jgi:hypothetical protein